MGTSGLDQRETQTTWQYWHYIPQSTGESLRLKESETDTTGVRPVTKTRTGRGTGTLKVDPFLEMFQAQ